MLKIASGCVALLALAACGGKPLPAFWDSDVYQAYYAENYQAHPFDDGPVSIVTAEHGEMRTYHLKPCRNGTRVCGNRAAELVKEQHYYVVSGAYHGRAFYLSPGGDGWLKKGDTITPLAWN